VASGVGDHCMLLFPLLDNMEIQIEVYIWEESRPQVQAGLLGDAPVCPL